MSGMLSCGNDEAVVWLLRVCRLVAGPSVRGVGFCVGAGMGREGVVGCWERFVPWLRVTCTPGGQFHTGMFGMFDCP